MRICRSPFDRASLVTADDRSMTIVLDRTLPVPLGAATARPDPIRHRLRRARARATGCPRCATWPKRSGVAPMTVAQVYRDLKQDGTDRGPGGLRHLRGPRPRATGAPPRSARRVPSPHRRICRRGPGALACRPATSPASWRRACRGRRAATADGAGDGRHLRGRDRRPMRARSRRRSGRAVDRRSHDDRGDLRRHESMRERAAMADLVLTFAHRRREVETLLPRGPSSRSASSHRRRPAAPWPRSTRRPACSSSRASPSSCRS